MAKTNTNADDTKKDGENGVNDDDSNTTGSLDGGVINPDGNVTELTKANEDLQKRIEALQAENAKLQATASTPGPYAMTKGVLTQKVGPNHEKGLKTFKVTLFNGTLVEDSWKVKALDESFAKRIVITENNLSPNRVYEVDKA